MPTNETAKIISICDKIDTITCCFSLGLVPTGSSDPYGLRRNSIGIIRIAESLDKHINLIDLINLSFKCYEANFDKQVGNDSRNKAVYFFHSSIFSLIALRTSSYFAGSSTGSNAYSDLTSGIFSV